MERLLTEEEIGKFKVEAEKRANDLQQTTEGHFKQEDIDGIYLDADKAMVKEQDSLTLKAVGEWLEKKCNISGDKWTIVDRFKSYIKSFRRGEMPEEGK